MAPADEATHTPQADAQAPQPEQTTPTAEQAPPEKDWKAEYARLRKDYDAKASRLNEVEKAITPEPEPEKVPAPQDDIDFKIENAGRIKLVKPEYQTYLAKGYSNADALRLAELDKGIAASSPEALRQQASASAPGIVNRESSEEITLSETDRRFNVKPETVAKWKHLVEGQG